MSGDTCVSKVGIEPARNGCADFGGHFHWSKSRSFGKDVKTCIGKFPAKLGTLGGIESLRGLGPQDMNGSNHIAETILDMESASVSQKPEDRMLCPILLGASGKNADGFVRDIFRFGKTHAREPVFDERGPREMVAVNEAF